MELHRYICGTELKMFASLLGGREKVRQGGHGGRRDKEERETKNGRKEERGRGGGRKTQKENRKKTDKELRFSGVDEKNPRRAAEM